MQSTKDQSMRKCGFVIFLAISFAISIPLFVFSTSQTSTGAIILLFLLGSYAPALGAWIVLRSGGTEEEKSLFREVLWKWVGGRWFLFAFLIPSVTWILAYIGLKIAGKGIAPLWAAFAGLPVILLVNYGEEIGWRGYALPNLLKRFNPFAASLMLGVIWGFFHVALNWQRPLMAFLTFVATLILSIILAWLFINTKSLLPGTLFHAVFNMWVQVSVTGENVTVLIVAIILSVFVAGYLLMVYGKGLAV